MPEPIQAVTVRMARVLVRATPVVLAWQAATEPFGARGAVANVASDRAARAASHRAVDHLERRLARLDVRAVRPSAA